MGACFVYVLSSVHSVVVLFTISSCVYVIFNNCLQSFLVRNSRHARYALSLRAPETAEDPAIRHFLIQHNNQSELCVCVCVCVCIGERERWQFSC